MSIGGAIFRILTIGILAAGFLPRTWAVEKKANLLYARHDGRNLYMDVYYPQTPPPKNGYPTIICFHGGGWATGNKHHDLFCKPLTEKGFAIASVQYRLSPQGKFPSQLRDIRGAARYLVDHATELRLDPQKFGAAGASAGGHLALLLANSQNQQFPQVATLPPDTIKAVCALYPPTDLVRIIPKNNRGRLDNLVAFLLGGTVNDRLARAQEGSPINYVSPDSPPTIFVHGDKDGLVPIDQSETMVKALRSQGVEAFLVIYQGAGHGFHPKVRTVHQIEQFFRRHLGVGR